MGHWDEKCFIRSFQESASCFPEGPQVLLSLLPWTLSPADEEHVCSAKFLRVEQRMGGELSWSHRMLNPHTPLPLASVWREEGERPRQGQCVREDEGTGRLGVHLLGVTEYKLWVLLLIGSPSDCFSNYWIYSKSDLPPKIQTHFFFMYKPIN